MSKSNSKPRTLEDRNPLAQSTFAAQCNHAQITGKMEIIPARTLVTRAFVGIILFLIVFGILAMLVSNAKPTQSPQGVNWSSRIGAA